MLGGKGCTVTKEAIDTAMPKKQKTKKPAKSKRLDGSTRIAGMGDAFDFTNGRRGCLTLWDNLSKQEQFDLINITSAYIFREFGDFPKNQKLKSIDLNEIKVCQVAFLQAMSPIPHDACQEARDQRGQVELPPDPTVSSIMVFNALQSRLLLWNACDSMRTNFFLLFLFLLWNCTWHFAWILIPTSGFIALSKMKECVAMREWYTLACNRFFLVDMFPRRQMPDYERIEFYSICYIGSMLYMTLYDGIAGIVLVSMEYIIPLVLLTLEKNSGWHDRKSFRSLRWCLAIINHAVLLICSWSSWVALGLCMVVFVPEISMLVLSLCFYGTGLIMTGFIHKCIPLQKQQAARAWMLINLYKTLCGFAFLCTLVIWKTWAWTFPYGTAVRFGLTLFTLQLLPNFVLQLALIYAEIGIGLFIVYFEKALVFMSIPQRMQTWSGYLSPVFSSQYYQKAIEVINKL